MNGQIDELQSAIAAAVEEQTATTGEVDRHVQAAVAGSNGITGSIADVSRATEESLRSAEQMRQAAGDVDGVVNGLRDLIGRVARELRLSVPSAFLGWPQLRALELAVAAMPTCVLTAGVAQW